MCEIYLSAFYVVAVNIFTKQSYRNNKSHFVKYTLKQVTNALFKIVRKI